MISWIPSTGSAQGTPSAAADAVESRLFRALAVLRLVVLANTVALSIHRADTFDRPVVGVLGVAAMIVWTGVAVWAYAEPRRRRFPLLAADLALAVGLLLLSPVAKGADFTASLPGFWILGALFAWAIHERTVGGLVAGALLAAVDLVQRQHVGDSDYGNAFLLVIGGPIVGFMCGSLQSMAAERDAAERAAAAAAERARLARVVHDGVLQVLALVARRGREQGGEAAALGELAARHERELRGLIRADGDATTAPQGVTVDLVSELTALERGTVTVSTPGRVVRLPAPTVHELVAAVRACLDNVRRHVGEDAPAFVLLQAFPDRVEVSVRDDGPGIPAGRLAEAAAEGRLGVAESIRGRVAALGGRAELVTGSFGTEWELVVPRTDLRPVEGRSGGRRREA
ncbi:MacS family sensor histidine kinase [Nocardioides sp. DS6]|uniref:MacS family sensor histidine kinase n=1 Tax=Nocardioides eburneus TaxID=3231482 RepID=A0ABV3SYI6_9ACTN